MAKSEIDVSIIIVNYNTYKLTSNCIKSVYAKTIGVSFEVILVDNASTECNADIFKKEYPGVILLTSTQNLGFAGGNNLGIALAKGKYVLLLNSDTELLNDAVTIAHDIMAADNQIGALSGQLTYPGGISQGIAGRFPTIKSQLLEIFRIASFYNPKQKAKLYLGDRWDYELGVEADWLWGAFFMMPKAVVDKFPGGKLHDEYFMYYEDVLWSYFINKILKLKIVYSPLPKAIHFHGASSDLKKDVNEHFKRVVLPNELSFLIKQKSKAYAFTYYLLKAIHNVTLRKPQHLNEAKFYWKFIYHDIIKGNKPKK